MIITTDFSQMNLQSIDMIYAISQQQLNGAVATALCESAPAISFAYANQGGNLVPATAQLPAVISFSGTWAPAIETLSGNLRVPVIDMSQGPTDPPTGQVILNLTFAADATLIDAFSGITYTQPDPNSAATPASAIWAVSFTVSLSLAALAASDLPQVAQNQLNILNGQYGAIFSVQQVVADLSTLLITATVQSTPPENVGDISWALFQRALELYLTTTAAAGSIPLAYLITQNTGTPTASPPAITPTAADFVILPNACNPALSALVFTMMSQGRDLPGAAGSPALLAPFNGVGFTDSNATGILVIQESLLAEVINQAVGNSPIGGPSPLLTTLSFYLAVEPPTGDWPIFTLQQDNNVPALSPLTPAVTNTYQIGAFTYSGNSINGQDSLFNQWSGNSRNTNTLSIALCYSATAETPSLVTINGSVAITCAASFGSGVRSIHDAQLDLTTFPFNASFQLQNDDTDIGAISFNMTVSNFNAPPTTQGPNTWDIFLALIDNDVLNTNFTNIRGSVGTYIVGCLAANLTASLTNLQSFVLPGNNVFTFFDVFINANCNLVVSMQYRDVG